MKPCLLPFAALLMSTGAYAITPPVIHPAELSTTGLPADTSDKDAKDADFAMKAAAGGMFEVQAAEVAKENGESQAVKDFADMMIKDHTAVNDKLKNIAGEKNIELPASLPEDKAAKLETLSTLSGAAFDEAYAEEMVTSHEETIALFEDEASSGEDEDLKSLAEESLPTLRHHLSEAEALKGEVEQ